MRTEMEPKKNTGAHTAEEKEQIRQAWRQSGKSKKDFCTENGIKYMTFIAWFSKRKGKKSGFVPLEVKKPHSQAQGIFAELDLGKGRRVVFHREVGPHYLQQLLK